MIDAGQKCQDSLSNNKAQRSAGRERARETDHSRATRARLCGKKYEKKSSSRCPKGRPKKTEEGSEMRSGQKKI